MDKKEFKRKWESYESITFDDVADCYVKWGLGSRPKTKNIYGVSYAVLVAAGVSDAKEYKKLWGE